MRIDAYGITIPGTSTQLETINASKSTSHESKLGVSQTSADDTTTLSSTSAKTASIHSLVSTALATTPSRAAKLEALKEAVSSAQYKLDSDKIAEALSSAEF